MTKLSEEGKHSEKDPLNLFQKYANQTIASEKIIMVFLKNRLKRSLCNCCVCMYIAGDSSSFQTLERSTQTWLFISLSWMPVITVIAGDEESTSNCSLVCVCVCVCVRETDP